MLDDKIRRLRTRLQKVDRQRRTRRRARQRGEALRVSLIGYTNAGKSTLFNRLTRAGALAADQLFAMLDPLTRRLGLGNGLEVVLSDTVGSIRNLPHGLVAAFRATLEETAEANLLLHVVDAGSPDRERQIEAVNQVIAEIGAGEVEQLMIYNKIDLTGNAPEVRLDPYGRISGLALSAGTGAGVDALRDLLRERAQARAQAVDESAWYGDEASHADASDPSDAFDDADPSADEDASDHPSS